MQIPSDKAAAVVACLFIVITLVSLGITIKTRAWFMMMVPITGVCEFGGYMIRFAMIHSPSIAKFTIQQVRSVPSRVSNLLWHGVACWWWVVDD